jgi:hypothetical protein
MVIHGAADALVPVACGIDTAQRYRAPACTSSKAWATTCRSN